MEGSVPGGSARDLLGAANVWDVALGRSAGALRLDGGTRRRDGGGIAWVIPAAGEPGGGTDDDREQGR